MDYVSVMDLFQLGWTSRMIWRGLGPPDRSLTRVPFPKDPKRHFYRHERVAEFSQSRAFQVFNIAYVINTHRVDLINGGSMKLLQDWADSVEITSDFPDVDLDEVIRLGVDSRHLDGYFDRVHFDPETAPMDVKLIWAYTYVKHECTNYDVLCADLKGRRFAQYCYPTILHRVNAEILSRFPELPVKGGAKGNQPIRVCRNCKRMALGEYNGHYWIKPKDWVWRSRPNRSRNVIECCSLHCMGVWWNGTYKRLDPNHHLLSIPAS